MMESLEEDPLQGRAAKSLGEFFIASSLAMTNVQELQTEMQEVREAASQDALQIKKLKQRETALYLEVLDLSQTDKETKRLLFEKSQETLSAHSKVLSLQNGVIDLQEKAEESRAGGKGEPAGGVTWPAGGRASPQGRTLQSDQGGAHQRRC